MKKALAHISRSLLGLVFVFSGFVKAVDPLGTTYKIEDYLKAFGGWFTSLLPLAETAAILLITFEFVLGVCLLLNIRTKYTAWITLVFYLFMTPLTLYIALVNPVSDCGCFGDAWVITNWQTFWKNIILLSLAIILLICKKEVWVSFVWQVELAAVSLSLIAVASFMGWTLNHLPVMDFRPYKVGNNIPQLMEYPEDAEPDVYETTFVYEKNGEEHEFSLETYPKGDPSWTFVRQNSKLVQKGYEPPIHDFSLTNVYFEDLTYDILESEDKQTLVIMYELSKSDMAQMDKVRTLIAEDNTYIVTGNSEEDINNFCNDNQIARERILSCDPVTLKTIVRANPGVITIQNGIITDKYNLKNKQL